MLMLIALCACIDFRFLSASRAGLSLCMLNTTEVIFMRNFMSMGSGGKCGDVITIIQSKVYLQSTHADADVAELFLVQFQLP
jgi:hypothetical protein